MLKPIETYYNGYRFRSRLEARWAVFFDKLWVEYAYETEGFDLNGNWYLPDFKISDAWIEVKGPPPNSRELYLAEQLALNDENENRVFIVSGDIWATKHEIVMFQYWSVPELKNPGIDDDEVIFKRTMRKESGEEAIMQFWTLLILHLVEDNESHFGNIYERLLPQVGNAYKAARQARFE
jgi:hypothetical protein